MTADLIVPARFNGPARSGNGGLRRGLARRAGAARASTRPSRSPCAGRHRSTPRCRSARRTAHRLADEAAVAEARVVDGDLDAGRRGACRRGRARRCCATPGCATTRSPTCFACGPDREEGDGLRIFPGPVGADRGYVASLWVPHALERRVQRPRRRASSGAAPAITWAALDCVGGWSEDLEGRPCVLGRMTARVDALPVVERAARRGRPPPRHDGRKSFTASTLYDADGRVVATARHTVDPGRPRRLQLGDERPVHGDLAPCRPRASVPSVEVWDRDAIPGWGSGWSRSAPRSPSQRCSARSSSACSSTAPRPRR